MAIQVLDRSVVAKIKAGEVIDRPASIVKELVENSIDAGASRISVAITGAGRTKIEVSDNGTGILPADLPLSVTRYATSKIRDYDDLFATTSLGFRGEALASIAMVARVTVLSRVEGDDAYTISADEFGIGEPELATRSVGTTVTVRGLFDTVPVRKKFLRSDSSEHAAIIDVVEALSLIHWSIQWQLTIDHRTIIQTSSDESQAERIREWIGRADGWVPVGESDPVDLPVQVTGFVSTPQLTFATRNRQIFAVNDRWVRASELQKVLIVAFQDTIPSRRFPMAVLHIRTTPNNLDVNIHPQKREIKFSDSSMVFRRCQAAIQAALPRASLGGDGVGRRDWGDALTPAERVSESPHSLGPGGDRESGLGVSSVLVTPSNPPVTSEILVSDHELARPTSDISVVASVKSDDFFEPLLHPIGATESVTLPFGGLSKIDNVQFFTHLNCYIVAMVDSRIILFDQHAVHERILYEKIKGTIDFQSDRQPLMFPEIVVLTPAKMNSWQTMKDQLELLGIVTEEFGHNQIIIREIYTGFGRVNPASFVETLLDNDGDETEGERADVTMHALKEMLQLRACKAAIKSGRKLHDAEIRQLIFDFLACPNNFTCPHGRPLYIELTVPVIERLFMRR